MTADYRILLDTPLSEDLALGFDELADAFRDVIENSDPQFAIGLYGSWGSGKTTLMKAIDERIDRSCCAVIWFSAWRYEKEQHLIVPLLDTIREGLVKWGDDHLSGEVKDTAKRVAATIGRAIASLLAGFTLKAGIPGGPEISYDVNKALVQANEFDRLNMEARVPRSFYHASFNALQDAFSEFTGHGRQRRIVVFVDDLDRCLPEGALEVLESMKLFFDISGFVFVVGLDLRIVEAGVAKRYRDILALEHEDLTTAPGNALSADVVNGASYLRKIFQIPFTLPPVSTDQIDEFLRSVRTAGNLPAAQWTEIEEQVRAHLPYLTSESGVNPREVKRYINAYTLVRKTKPFLDPSVVLALQTLAFRADWRQLQFSLLAFRQAFLDSLRRYTEDPAEGSLEAVGISLSALPQSFATYLEFGQPGNVLVSQSFDVDRYIYGGEATRSSISAPFLNVFRAVGQLPPLIRKVASHAAPSSDLVESVATAKAVLQSSDEAPRATVIVRELEALEVLVRVSDVDGLRDSPQNERARMQELLSKFEAESIAIVQRVTQQLQQLYQAGII